MTYSPIFSLILCDRLRRAGTPSQLSLKAGNWLLIYSINTVLCLPQSPMN
ncbi:hypothetical protein [Nostoc sp.]